MRELRGSGFRESRCDEIRRHARWQLEDTGVLLKTEPCELIDTNLGPGPSCLDVPRLLEFPSLLWRLGEDLLDILPAELTTRVDVVAGFGTAGVIFAHVVAALLDSRRPLTAPRCRFAAFEEHERAEPSLSPGYASGLNQRTLLIVDAWGQARPLSACACAARKAGAIVIGAAAIGASAALAFDFPFVVLCECPAGAHASPMMRASVSKLEFLSS